MSVAIVTKYHGPTDTKGARVSARMTGARTAWIPYPHELSGLDVHAAAAAVQMARAGEAWLLREADKDRPDDTMTPGGTNDSHFDAWHGW